MIPAPFLFFKRSIHGNACVSPASVVFVSRLLYWCALTFEALVQVFVIFISLMKTHTLSLPFGTLTDERVPEKEDPEEGDHTLESSEKLHGWRLIWQHSLALYAKRFYNSKRNIKGFICEVCIANFINVL